MSWTSGDVRLSVAAKRTTPLGIESLDSPRTSCLSRASFIRGRMLALPSLTQGGSRMPESGPFGSVRGMCSNAHPYRDIEPSQLFALLAAVADQSDSGTTALEKTGRLVWAPADVQGIEKPNRSKRQIASE